MSLTAVSRQLDAVDDHLLSLPSSDACWSSSQVAAGSDHMCTTVININDSVLASQFDPTSGVGLHNTVQTDRQRIVYHQEARSNGDIESSHDSISDILNMPTKDYENDNENDLPQPSHGVTRAINVEPVRQNGGEDAAVTASAQQRAAALTCKNSRFKPLVHPLDKGVLMSYLLSLIYLVAALATFGPTVVIVVIIFPFCVLLFRAIKFMSTKYGAVSETLSGHEEFWLGEHSVAQCIVTMSPGLDVIAVRQLLLSRLAFAENYNNDKIFPRLTQRLVTSRTHHAWVDDINFDINNHVIDASTLERVTTDDDLRRYVAHAQTRELPRSRPLWEAHVLCNVGIAQDTVVLMRLDASIADGVLFFSNLCKQLTQNNVGYGIKPFYGRIAYPFNIFRSLFVGFLVFFDALFTFKDQNLLRGRPLSGNWTLSLSTSMSLSQAMRIKDITRTTLNDVILAVLSGSLREYLITHGMTNPFDMRAAVLLSLRKHKTFRNARRLDGHSDRDRCGDSTADSSMNMFRDIRVEPLRQYPVESGLDASSSRLTLPSLSLNSPDNAVDGGANSLNGVSSIRESANMAHLHPDQRISIDEDSRPVSHHGLQATRSNTPSTRQTVNNALTDIQLSLVSVPLATNTEGAIPQLWDIKQRMNELKNSTDHVVFYNSNTILRYILPRFLRQKIWRLFFNRCTLLVSNLPGPDDLMTFTSGHVGMDSAASLTSMSHLIKNVVCLPPAMDDIGVNVSFMTYAGQLQMAVNSDKSVLPDPELLTSIFVRRMNALAQLLSNRRLPGERTGRRLDRRLQTEPDINQIQSRMVEVQKQLQHLGSSFDVQQHIEQQTLTDEEAILMNQMESLKLEFHEMLQQLRRRMSEQHSDDGLDDIEDEDGELRHPRRLRSLSGVSHRSILSALSAGASRVLQTGSPSPSASSSTVVIHSPAAVTSSDAGPSTISRHSSQQRKYHSFHLTNRSPTSRPGSRQSRSRMSLDSTHASSLGISQSDAFN